MKKLYQKFIISQYQKLRRKKFHFYLDSKEIHVKKGNLRYTVLAVEMPSGKVKFTINRSQL